MGLKEVIEDHCKKVGEPDLEGFAEWQRAAKPGEYYLMDACGAFNYLQIAEGPEPLPEGFAYAVEYAPNATRGTATIAFLPSLAFPLSKEQFEAARQSGFRTGINPALTIARYSRTKGLA